MSEYRQQLVTMVELQQAEMEILSLEQDLAGIDDRIDALNSEVHEMENTVAAAAHRVDDLKKQYREDEGEIQIIDGQIAKSQEKLSAVKTNKEYQSTLKEIDDLKDKTSGIEDRMLESLEQIETADVEVAEQQADLEEVKIDVADKQADIRKKGEAQQERLQQWRKAREDILARIESRLQVIYGKVKIQSNGRAMAGVHDGICEVCRLGIPPQLFNDLMRMDSLKMCPHCQRIMYPKVVEEEID